MRRIPEWLGLAFAYLGFAGGYAVAVWVPGSTGRFGWVLPVVWVLLAVVIIVRGIWRECAAEDAVKFGEGGE